MKTQTTTIQRERDCVYYKKPKSRKALPSCSTKTHQANQKKKRKKVSRRERAFLGQHLRLRDLAGQLTFRRRSIEKHPRHKRRKLSRRSVMCGNEKEEEEEENIFRCVYKLLFNDRTKQRRVDTTFFFFVCIPNRSESLERFLPKKKERKKRRERERGNIYWSINGRQGLKKGMKGLLGKGGLPGRHTSPRRLATCFLQALVCCSSVVSKFFPLRPGRRDGSQSPHYSTASAILRVLYALDNSAEEGEAVDEKLLGLLRGLFPDC